jgi:hypothetical protein
VGYDKINFQGNRVLSKRELWHPVKYVSRHILLIVVVIGQKLKEIPGK